MYNKTMKKTDIRALEDEIKSLKKEIIQLKTQKEEAENELKETYRTIGRLEDEVAYGK